MGRRVMGAWNGMGYRKRGMNHDRGGGEWVHDPRWAENKEQNKPMRRQANQQPHRTAVHNQSPQDKTHLDRNTAE